jgi:hypothetical protein
MRARIGMIAVLLFVVAGFPSSALACEKYTLMYDSLVKMCSSGYANGVQYCYGGFGTDCTTGGVCGTGGVGDDGPFSPDFSVAVKPCLTCTGAEPAQGFVLRSDKTPSEALAEK